MIKVSAKKCDSCHSDEECELLSAQKDKYDSELMFLCPYCKTKKGFKIISGNPVEHLINNIAKGLLKKGK